MPVSHRLRCVFVHVPKCGGTSIERKLGLLGDWRRPDLSRLFGKHRIGKEVLMLQHLTALQLASGRFLPRADFDAFFKFAFVRNPWDRVISEYEWRRSLGQPERLPPILDRQRRIDDFKLFLDRSSAHLQGSPHDVSRLHFLPQCAFVLDEHGEPLIDFMGRFEKLQEGFSQIAARLELPGSARLGRSNATNRLAHPEYYDSEARERIADLYSEDIERFTYTF